MIIDKNHTIESVGEDCLTVLHKERRELIGGKCYLAVHGTNEPPAFCPLRDKETDITPANYAAICQELLQGNPPIRCMALYDDDGRVLRVLGLARQEEHQTTVRELLDESDFRYEEILDTIPHALLVADALGTIRQTNEAAATLFGFKSKAQLRDRSIYEFIVPENRTHFQSEWQTILRQGSLDREEALFQQTDGTVIPCSFKAATMKSASGGVSGVIITVKDIALWKQLKDSLTFSDVVLESIREGVVAWDEDFTIVHWNSGSEKLFGVNAQNALGKKLSEVVKMTDLGTGNTADWKRPSELVETYETDFLLSSRNATSTIHGTIATIRQNGVLQGSIAIFSDVTERQQMSEHISIMNSAVSSSINAVAMADLNGNITFTNDSLLKLWGYNDRNEVLGKSALDFWQEPDKLNEIFKLLNNIGRWSGELIGKKKDDSNFFAMVTTHMVKDNNGKPLCIMASIIDITEEKKAREALKESEAFISSLLQNSHHPTLVINPDTSIRYVNPAFERLTGYTINELEGKKAPYPWTIQESMPRTAKEFRLAMHGGPKWYEELYRKKNGKNFWVEIASAPVKKDGVLYYYIVSWVDVTDRRLIEEELTKERDRQRTYMDTVGIMVATIDAHGIITMVNRKACETLGFNEKELVNQNWFDMLVPQRNRSDIRKRFRAILNQDAESAKLSEGILITKAGEEKLFTFSHTLLHVPDKKTPQILISAEDTTELHKTQEQLGHSHLLASLGEMTAGIAHEVNNPLGSILLYAELLMASDVPAQVKKDLKVIHDEAKRATRIMTDLLIYARRTKPQVRRINLNSIIRKVMEMRRYQHKVQNITVKSDLTDTPIFVKGDSSQLMQVVMNIILNAEDALRENKGGEITVTNRANHHWAKIQISDNGPGIPEDSINQIFYPFFTTKPVGEGTGLGLSICYGIVTAHGGLIRAENNSHGGATFTVELPLSRGRNGNGNGSGNTKRTKPDTEDRNS